MTYWWYRFVCHCFDLVEWMRAHLPSWAFNKLTYGFVYWAVMEKSVWDEYLEVDE